MISRPTETSPANTRPPRSGSRPRRSIPALAVGTIGVVCRLAGIAAAQNPGVFDVRSYGAKADGHTLDTPAIQKAIDACATAGGGQVRLGPGHYLSGSIRLRSDVTLYLDAGARLVGTPDLAQYTQPRVPDYMPEARWGKWHRGLILAQGCQRIAIAGPGVIDGNKVFDPTGEERMRGPHTFVFVGCRDVTLRDLTFIDSANYAVFFQVSSDVTIDGVQFIGGWDGVHFRGAPNHPCRNVSITDCRFYTGDDAIAGRYWDNTLIAGCIVNSSCNGIRLIGPAEHLLIHDCLFYGPGVRPHRTSGRRNMLAAINLQPGAWDATRGTLDDVRITDITMHNVATPFHFVLRKPNTAGRITVDRVSATGVYRAAASIESWADQPFGHVVFRDVTLEYTGGGKPPASRTVEAPGVDARPLPAWGFYLRNADTVELDNVRLRTLTDDARPVLIAENIDRLTIRDVNWSPSTGRTGRPMVLKNVKHLIRPKAKPEPEREAQR